jgi:LEA14-like dessication related protein
MKAAAWWLTGGLFLAGCTPLGLWLYEDPVVTVSRITLQLVHVEPSRTPLIVALAVENANDYPLSTEQVELSLRLDGVPIGQLRRDSQHAVPTDTISTLALPLALAKHATPGRLRALGSGTHTFAVRGPGDLSNSLRNQESALCTGGLAGVRRPLERLIAVT